MIVIQEKSIKMLKKNGNKSKPILQQINMKNTNYQETILMQKN